MSVHLPRSLAAALVFIVLGAEGFGCGGASPERQGGAAPSAWESGDEADTSEAEPMLGTWEAELSELVDRLESETVHHASALHAGRCDDGEELADRICALADQICEIADSHAAAQPRCEDAESRCASARERVADECNR